MIPITVTSLISLVTITQKPHSDGVSTPTRLPRTSPRFYNIPISQSRPLVDTLPTSPSVLISKIYPKYVLRMFGNLELLGVIIPSYLKFIFKFFNVGITHSFTFIFFIMNIFVLGSGHQGVLNRLPHIRRF